MVGLLLQVKKGILWRILPIDNDDMNIEAATGIEWGEVLPVMLEVGLSYSVMTSGVNSYEIQRTGWDSIKATIETHRKLQINTVRRFKGDNQHFFAIGKTLYQSPIDQQKAVESGELSDVVKGVTRLLRRRVSEIALQMLDEKWFYTTFRRRKRKVLPHGLTEEVGADFVRFSSVRSRRHPVKVMFLGVIACPHPEKEFDGKLHMERVSRLKTLARMSRQKSFSDDVLINEELKAGGWREYHTDGMTFEDLLADVIIASYCLEADVAERLDFTYRVGTAIKSTQMHLVVADHALKGPDGGNVALTINDVELFVK